MRHLLLTALLLAPFTAKSASPFDAETAQVLQNGFIVTAEDFIIPGYTAWADAAEDLAKATRGYCDGSSPLTDVHSAFAKTFLAWQRISVIQIGPITQAEGMLRIQLWPDPKGFSRRAIRAAISAEDPALLEPGALVGRSVALVNLTGLERLLYDDLPIGSYACAFAAALSRHQSLLAADVLAQWTASDFRTAFDTAATGNALYPNMDSLIREFLAGTVVYTDRLRKFKLERGLGDAPGKARPERSEARASGLGLQSIAVSFLALRDLYELPLGFFDVTPDVGGSMEFFILGETAGSIHDALIFETRSLSDLLTEDGPAAEDLRRYAQLTLFHEEYLKNQLPASLGLAAGFTSADGD